MRRRVFNYLFWTIASLCAAGALIVLGTILTLVIYKGAGAISFDFLTQEVAEAGAEGGIFYHLAGTVILMMTAAAFAVPIAAGVGIFLIAYLPHGKRRRTAESLIHAMNGVPSIVFGLFGLAFFVQLLGMKKSWLAGGILLGMMILPTIAVAFVEKLRTIPATTVEAAFGLGLSRARVVLTVLLPQAASGLVTGTLLGLARAAGETAPIMFTAVIFSGATVPSGIIDSPVLALPYHIFVLAQDSFDARAAENVWGAAIVLIGVVVTLAAIALPLRIRIHEEARRV